jgi:hypothetical protein
MQDSRKSYFIIYLFYNLCHMIWPFKEIQVNMLSYKHNALNLAKGPFQRKEKKCKMWLADTNFLSENFFEN